MRGTPAGRFLVSAFALAIAAFAIQRPGLGEDAAALFPKDSLFFVGWSDVFRDQPDTERTFDMVCDLLRSVEPDDEEAEMIVRAIGLLRTALGGTGGVALLDLGMQARGPDIQAALVVNAGEKSQSLADGLERLLSDSGGPAPQAAPIGTATAQRLVLPDAPFDVYWGVHKSHFFLALGEVAAGRIVAQIDGGGPSLADNEELRFDRRKAQDPGDARVQLFADVRTLIAKARSLAATMMGELPPIVDAVIEQSGISSVRSKYFFMSRGADGVPRSGYFAHVDGPYRGLLTLWQQQPLTMEDLRVVPEDAYWMQASNLDLAGLWDEALRVTQALFPPGRAHIDEFLAEFEEEMGFSFERDLLRQFGDTWVTYDAAGNGGLILTGTVLVADVKDPRALQATLTKIVGKLQEELDREAAILLRSGKRGNHEVHYVAVSGVPFPFSPAWGFVDGRWVVGLTPQTVLTAMQNADPSTRGKTILDRREFADAWKQLPKNANGVSFVDWHHFARIFYPVSLGLQTAGLSMAGRGASNVDLMLVPTLSEMLARTHNGIGTCTTDDDGILYAQIGDGMPFGVLAGGFAMAGAAAVPAMVKARGQAQEAVAMSNLRGITQGCHIYANDNRDEMPPSLDVLIEQGMISEEMLHAPWDESGDRWVTYVPGHDLRKSQRPSEDIVAYGSLPRHNQVAAAFLDGHVRRCSVEEFSQLIQATYERLGRPEDVPAEFR